MSDTATIVRAATFPFFPHGGPQDWPALDAVLRHAWQMSTKLANWAISELFLADQLTLGEQAEKLPPMPFTYLYGLAGNCYPDWSKWKGLCQEAQTIFRKVDKKYKEKRLDIVGRGISSLPSYRYPFPFFVHNKDWEPFYGDDGVPLVEVPLPGSRIVLRLRGGQEMRRQLGLFKQLVAGAKKGELSLHRKGKRVMVKLVGHFPVSQPKEQEGVLLVRTDSNALWVAEGERIAPRIWNQDHIRHSIENHRVWLQRISEDMKYEKRVPAKMKRHILQKIEDRCRKQNDRLDTYCHEMSKQLAQFAERQKVGTVMYDDSAKDYMPRFPWFQLREKLRYKLEERGIKLLIAPNGSAQAG